MEYDGRELGDAFRDLRSPPPGMLLFGGMMVNRVDIQHFLDMRRSLRSLAHCTRLLLRYARDRVKYPRGTRLAMGNALIARMATTALRKGMSLRLNVNVLTLCEAQGAVRGVEIEYQGQERRCTPDAGWCWPQAASPRARWRRAIGRTPASISPCRRRPTMAPRCISRRRLTLAREPIGPPTFLGAGIGADPGRRQRGALPHLVTDRAKPGVIAVNQRAVRFVNESSSYHHFASAMQDAAENAPCFYSATPRR